MDFEYTKRSVPLVMPEITDDPDGGHLVGRSARQPGVRLVKRGVGVIRLVPGEQGWGAEGEGQAPASVSAAAVSIECMRRMGYLTEGGRDEGAAAEWRQCAVMEVRAEFVVCMDVCVEVGSWTGRQASGK